jgi:hypothetical protein
LNDKRLNDRFAVILDRLSSKPNVSIPGACKGWSETLAAYRFFDNAKLSPERLLAPHVEATTRRAREYPVVLVAQDTTEIEWTRKQEKVGGPLTDENRWGAYAHPCLVLTPERVPLGVIHANLWTRDPDDFHKRNERAYKPLEEKESFRWLVGYRQSCRLAEECPQTRVVCLSDSEGDIYECLQEGVTETNGRCADWIVRACQDRRLQAPSGQKLYAAVSQAAVCGQATVEVSAREQKTGDGSRRRGARSARQAKVTIRATTVTLKAPERRGAAKTSLRNVSVNVVMVREESPPTGEEPIEWVLITSLPIDTPAAVRHVVEYYCCRWEIEIYFRVLKSGCQVEELQLETTERMLACLSVYLIVAWRVMFVTMMGRACPEMSSEVILDVSEWQSVHVLLHGGDPPEEPPSLGEAIVMIASLGGHLDRKHDGPPGPKCMWIGIQRMRDFSQAWNAFGPGKLTCDKR